VFSRLTTEPSSMRPLWSPDGSALAYATNRGAAPGIYRISASGGPAQLLFKDVRTLSPTDWSQDGRYLLYQRRDERTKEDLWILPLEPGRQPLPYLRSEFNETQARFSPNGRWIAYVSDQSGRPEVYVQRFPLTGERWQVSNDGGHEPTWRRDGRELFYLTGDRRLMSVPVQTATRLTLGAASELFRLPRDTPNENRISYAASADAQRFVVNLPAQERVRRSPLETGVILNWPSTVSR
jgi:Tol biopolymer transport system component